MRGGGWLMAAFFCLCDAARPARADRGSFSWGAFGGKANHANTTGRLNYAGTPGGFEPVDAEAIGLNLRTWPFWESSNGRKPGTRLTGDF
jgi:hypothetical protein